MQLLSTLFLLMVSLMVATLAGCASETQPVGDVSADEEVVFFPTYAHLDEDGQTWTVPLHGIIYELETDSLRRGAVVKGIDQVLQVEADTPAAENLDRQVRLFLVDNERGQTVFVRMGDEVYEAGTSGANGHFQGTIQLPAAEAERLLAGQEAEDGFLSFEAVTRKSDGRQLVGRVQLVGQTGLSIISDMDDTIKHSQVGDHKAVLANTFLHPFKPAPGMPEFYQECAQKGVVFHYVSGSPWQLYLPLSEFLVAEGLPPGSFNLKHFRLRDPSTLVGLLQSQESTKLPAIERIMAAYPKRRFILIGDSGEQDPEIYAKVARQHEEQVLAILIRNVTAEDGDGSRFKAVRDGLGDVQFHLFDEPAEVRPIVKELIRQHGA